MLRLLGDTKVEYLPDGIISYYHCVNGAGHDSPCNYACWLNHPNPELHLPKLSTEEAIKVYDKHFKLSDATRETIFGTKKQEEEKGK